MTKHSVPVVDVKTAEGGINNDSYKDSDEEAVDVKKPLINNSYKGSLPAMKTEPRKVTKRVMRIYFKLRQQA